MTDAVLGLKVDSTGADRGTLSLDKLVAASKRAEGAALRLAQAEVRSTNVALAKARAVDAQARSTLASLKASGTATAAQIKEAAATRANTQASVLAARAAHQNAQAKVAATAAANDNVRASTRQAAATRKIIADLEFERVQLKRTAAERALHNNLRQAGVKAASAEGAAIAKVTAALHAEEQALARRNKLSAATIGRGAGFAGIAAGAAVFGSLKSFADFEQGLVGVAKTTGIAGAGLARLGDEVRALSLDVPVATNEMLSIAQAAGQLGVKGTDNILKFTETVSKLGLASNLSGEDAATTLARILTVTGTAIGDVDKLGSTIVRLGNNFAATEAEIAEVATRVAQGTAQFNVSAAEVAGIGTALRAVGVQAEAGGTVIGRAFQAINDAVRQGGAELTAFTKITGLSAKELKELFEQDATAAFQAVVEGLGRIHAGGGDVAAALSSVGLEGVRIIQVLGTLATRSGVLADALNQANEEWSENAALNREAAEAAKSFNAQAQLTWNAVKDLAIAIGTDLEPAASAGLRAIRKMTEGVGGLKSEIDELAKNPSWEQFVRVLFGGGAEVTIPVSPPPIPFVGPLPPEPGTPPPPNLGGGKAAKKAAESYADLTRGARQFTAAQELARNSYLMTAEAAAALRYEQDLLNKAENDGLTLSAAQRAELHNLAQGMATAEEATRVYAESVDFAKDVTGGFLGDLRQGLKDGEDVWGSFANAATKALEKIEDRLFDLATNKLVDSLFASLLGGGAPDAGGGLFSALFPGRAGGGPVMAGSPYIVGERGRELFVPRQSGSVVPNHALGGGGGGFSLQIVNNGTPKEGEARPAQGGKPGRDWTLTLDDINAKNIRRGGSASNSAVRQLGGRTPLVER